MLRCGSQLMFIMRCLCYMPKTAVPLWEQQWPKIVAMRKREIAPVDTMGADALAKRGVADSKQFRFQTLIATMLSPQTRDEQTTLAFENLKAIVHPSSLTPHALCSIPLEKVEAAIKPVSFYTTKARNIVRASQRCVSSYDGDIPSSIDDLLEFDGVGPKIAYLTFTIAWGKTLGICVDTHVHRIANRLGWVDTWKSKSNGPEKTRVALEQVLPRDKWEEVNGLIVGFGQTICSAKSPKCSECTLTESCKYYQSGGTM